MPTARQIHVLFVFHVNRTLTTYMIKHVCLPNFTGVTVQYYTVLYGGGGAVVYGGGESTSYGGSGVSSYEGADAVGRGAIDDLDTRA